jgi:S-formylglutathione hydrolase FrmB
MGISMGGYGALAMAERYPGRFRAAAAISPAVWTTFNQAHAANAGAFASEEAFIANDVIANAARLAHTPTRVAVGVDDPFYPGVMKLINLPAPSGPRVAVTSKGCHTSPFFLSQEPPSLAFLAFYLD